MTYTLLVPPLVDLREHFGIWEHCGQSRWWRKVPWGRRHPDSQRIYVNPIDGQMISAFEYPQVPGQAWRVTVRDGQAVSDETMAEIWDRVKPWVRRVMSDFFRGLRIFDMAEAAGSGALAYPSKLAWFLDSYKDQTREYAETGSGHQEIGKDEVLTGSIILMGEMGQENIVLEKVILKDELPELTEAYGLLEC